MRIDLYCFPSKLERQPSRYQNFEAQSHSLFSRCLRLATTITGSHPRLATGGWLDLTRQAFHLLDYSPLSGRTIPICLSVFSNNGRPRKKVAHSHFEIMRFFCLCTFSYIDWCKFGVRRKVFRFPCVRKPLILRAFSRFGQSKGFIVGKNKTSRIAGESVSSITIRSMPKPIPPVGGIPSSRA